MGADNKGQKRFFQSRRARTGQVEYPSIGGIDGGRGWPCWEREGMARGRYLVVESFENDPT